MNLIRSLEFPSHKSEEFDDCRTFFVSKQNRLDILLLLIEKIYELLCAGGWCLCESYWLLSREKLWFSNDHSWSLIRFASLEKSSLVIPEANRCPNPE